ncbi:MAG: hypothetical protein NT069_17680, partial [Planctomycetota bacterium]|nr:hypothetical protein [Planctomycetota bacterium]
MDQIQIAVRGSAQALKDAGGADITNDPQYRSLLVSTAVYVNAAVSALELRRELRLRGNRQPVVFGIYQFETLMVQSLPGKAVEPTDKAQRLRRAPATPDDLVAYAAEVATALLA